MGVLIAIVVIGLWGVHLAWLLTGGMSVIAIAWSDSLTPFPILHSPFCILYSTFSILVQAFLTTGLFITAHDAMHGTVSCRPWINTTVGFVASLLFAGMWYPRLTKNHHLHHAHPTAEHDPDFHSSENWFKWFASFMIRYTTIPQLVFMAVAYNVLKIWVPEPRLWLYWIVPSFLATIQLFTVGTYWPHKRPASLAKPHYARSMKRSHAKAMLACWFFGYHHEHHHSPSTPWWKLWRLKE